MWKDLTLKQKAEIMKMSVANGVTDINDIQQLYDGSIGHRFDDGSGINIITTSGNGYIPPIKPETVIDAAFNYATGNGKIPISVIRKRLYDNLYPYGYTSPVTRVHNAVVNNKKEPRIVRNIPDRDDIFAEYLQIPKNERHHLPGTMYVKDSEYAPTMGGTNNVKYKKLDLTDAQKEKIILATNSLNFGENRLSKIKHKFDEAKSKPRKYTDTQAAAMVLNSYFGEYTLGKGLDPQKGEYRSYYDLWDLSPVSTYGKDETRGIGKPVPFYDRIYLSDYYGVEPQSLLPYKGDYFGKWLPELIVTNKKALGGHLYKEGGNRQQLGIIDSILTKYGVNYTKTSGYRGPNSKVGKLGSKSAHARTLSDGSSAAIDIVPGPGSSWAKLYAQMSSPEVRADLAKYGLDILDETSAATMKDTGATGKHFHIGKGIKGQQGKGVFVNQNNPTISAYYKMYGRPDLSISNNMLYNPAQDLQWHSTPIEFQRMQPTFTLAPTIENMELSAPEIKIPVITPIEKRVPIRAELSDIAPLLSYLPDQQTMRQPKMVLPKYTPTLMEMQNEPYILFGRT